MNFDSYYEDPIARGEVGISELQEKVLDLLEQYGVPTDTNDKIMALIEAAELASDEASQQAAFWEEGE